LGNRWGGHISPSGKGSDPEDTHILVDNLPIIFKDLGIQSVLDVGCGSFTWMDDVTKASGVRYTGVDIVDEAIEVNKAEQPYMDFRVCDATSEPLPSADLAIVRDMLQHLSLQHGVFVIRNAISHCDYLMATTFPDVTVNEEAQHTGHWRPLNLHLAPFYLPPADILFQEVRDGKLLCVWHPEHLKEMHCGTLSEAPPRII